MTIEELTTENEKLKSDNEQLKQKITDVENKNSASEKLVGELQAKYDKIAEEIAILRPKEKSEEEKLEETQKRVNDFIMNL